MGMIIKNYVYCLISRFFMDISNKYRLKYIENCIILRFADASCELVYFRCKQCLNLGKQF